MSSQHLSLVIFAMIISLVAKPVYTMQDDLGRIAREACSGSGSTSMPSSEAIASSLSSTADNFTVDTTDLLHDLTLKVLESKQAASVIVNEVSDKWSNGINRDSTTFHNLEEFVSGSLTITMTDDGSLSQRQRQLVQVLIQISRLVHFLENQEGQTYYGQKASSLLDLKGRLEQVVCAARQLLTDVSDNAIQGIIGNLSPLNSIQMSQYSHGLRRIVCAVALERMVAILGTIHPDDF